MIHDPPQRGFLMTCPHCSIMQGPDRKIDHRLCFLKLFSMIWRSKLPKTHRTFPRDIMYTDVKGDLPDVVCFVSLTHLFLPFPHLWEWMVLFLKASQHEYQQRKAARFRNCCASRPRKRSTLLVLNPRGAAAQQMTCARIMAAQTEEWAWGFSAAE